MSTFATITKAEILRMGIDDHIVNQIRKYKSNRFFFDDDFIDDKISWQKLLGRIKKVQKTNNNLGDRI